MSTGLNFDGTDPAPNADVADEEIGPDADLVGDDVDDAERETFPDGARFDDEQWAVLQQVRAEHAAAGEQQDSGA